jgi:hypothetical protein
MGVSRRTFGRSDGAVNENWIGVVLVVGGQLVGALVEVGVQLVPRQSDFHKIQ